MKLTEAQKRLLQDASRRPSRVMAGYGPTNELEQLGFVSITTMEGSRIWTVTVTAAGRTALAEAQFGEDRDA